MSAFIDPVLSRFRIAVGDAYGGRVERVTLFGSRARGDARADSDYDVAIFLKDLSDRREERRRLASLRADFLDDTGLFFDVKSFPITAYADDSPLMYEIRRDGRDL